MDSIDEHITDCLEKIDENFVTALDTVMSMNKSIKTISSNLKEMDRLSKVWLGLFEICGGPLMSLNPVETVLDKEPAGEEIRGTNTEDIPSFIKESDQNTSYLKYVSPPRTTKIYLPLNTPRAERETSAMDTSSSSLGGYSPPITPILKRRKQFPLNQEEKDDTLKMDIE